MKQSDGATAFEICTIEADAFVLSRPALIAIIKRDLQSENMLTAVLNFHIMGGKPDSVASLEMLTCYECPHIFNHKKTYHHITNKFHAMVVLSHSQV